MLTTTSAFATLKLQHNLNHRLILKIERAGSSNIYFSDVDFRTLDDSTDVMVHGLVNSWGTYSSSMNIFTKDLNINNVTIKMSNGLVAHTGTAEVRTNYELASANFINRTATIYVWFEGITDINTDGLKIFEGIVQPIKNADDKTFQLYIKDVSLKHHVNLPVNKLTVAAYSDLPTNSVNKPMPIIYGSRNMNGEMIGALHEVVWLSTTKCMVSDLPAKAVNSVWIWDGTLNRYAEIDSSDYSVTLDDSGRTTITFSDIETPDIWVYFFPDAISQLGDTIPDLDDADEVAKTYDLNEDTYLGVYTTVGAEIDNALKITFSDDVGEGITLPHIAAASCKLGVKAKDLYNSYYDAAWFEYRSIGSTPAGEVDLLNIDSENSYSEANMGDIFSGGETWAEIIDSATWYIWGAFDSKAAGSVNLNFKIYHLRLKNKYIPFRLDNESIRIFVDVDGRKYGSWIDAGGRSNSYDENDLIENPAFIIEDILRRDLSVATADIDVASFDAASTELASWKQTFRVSETVNSLSLIKEICKQAKLVYFLSDEGQARLWVFKSSYSSDDILYNHDIKMGSLKLAYTTMGEFCNDVDVNYKKHAGTDRYQETAECSDSTSQTTYNITIDKTVNADKIDDSATAALLADHFTDSSTGFWNDIRPILSFTCAHWEYIHWEKGDIIRVDSSIDAIIRDGQLSWERVQMLITKKKVTADSVSFEMIKVATIAPPP